MNGKKMKPNMYQVTYLNEFDKMKTKIIETLGDCIKFNNIVKVNHVYHILEVHDEIPIESVGMAIDARRKMCMRK